MKSVNLDKIFSIVFLSLLLVVSVSGAIFSDQDIEGTENRKATTWPSFNTVGINSQSLAQASSYFDDHFGLRKYFIKFHRSVRDLFPAQFGNRVIHGKQDWTFFYQAVRLYQGKADQVRIQIFLNQLKKFRNEVPNIPIIVVVVPAKPFVYSEFLPSFVRSGFQRDKIVSDLRDIEGLKVLDLLPILLDAKETRPSFLRYDTHWNGWGAYVGYMALVEFINLELGLGIPVREITDFTEDHSHSGDLAQMLGKKGTLTDIQYLPNISIQQAVEIPKLFTSESAFVPDYKNPKGQKKVFVLHDSFMQQHLAGLLAESFSEVRYLWSFDFNKVIPSIAKQKPDFILIEVVDRHILAEAAQ